MPDRWTQATEDALTQMLAAEFVVANVPGITTRDPNRTAARAVLDWAAHRGLLVEPGGDRCTWKLPPEPGLEVTRVLDQYGQYFERYHDEHPGEDVWIGQTFAGDADVDDLELEWNTLMAYQAPLTDATPCSTCGGTGSLKCLAHQAGDGCDELSIVCPDCQP